MEGHIVNNTTLNNVTGDSTVACIDLSRQFDNAFVVRRDPAARRANARTNDAWHFVIPCKFGHICPWGDSLLAASVDGHRMVSSVLSKTGVCKLVQDGDDGQTFTFDVSNFPAVAKIMRPRLRRLVSEPVRERMRRRMQAVEVRQNRGSSDRTRVSTMSVDKSGVSGRDRGLSQNSHHFVASPNRPETGNR